MRNEIIPTVPVEIPVDDEVEQLQDTFASMSLGSLRKRLRQKNLDVGPIDTRNRRLYEAKLARFEVGVASPFGESSAPSEWRIKYILTIL